MRQLNEDSNIYSKKPLINKYLGYTLLAIYAVVAIGLLYYCIALNMFPTMYLVIIAVAFIILGVLSFLMHERLTTSIIASVVTVLLIICCIVATYYIMKTNQTLADVTTADTQLDIVSVYVMDDDPAEVLEDIKGYKIGILENTDRENTDKTIDNLEDSLDSVLDTVEYENMFTMVDDLKKQEIQAVIINDAYVGIVADVEEYNWVSTDIRKITEVAHEIEIVADNTLPENMPETFVMYLSGIDTYGGIAARSRSDVNILAVVNTKTKNILLLSTPRDSYVDFSVTGGAKDKLTHAGIYGVEASIDALERLYGIHVDYYLRVNFTGFIEIIDALGGVEVYSDYDFSVKNIRSYQKGMNQLTGLEALAFARERYSFPEGDFQRAKNQMEVIRAVIQKCASSSMLMNYSSVMNAVAGSFETNMPNDHIAALVKMQLSDMAQWNVTSYTTDGHSRYAETYSMPGTELYVIDLDPACIEEAKRLIQEIYNTETQNPEVRVE